MSYFTVILIIILLLVQLTMILFNYITKKSQKNSKGQSNSFLLDPPSPSWKLPIVGHLHLLGGYEVPYQAFTDLAKKFGDVVKLQLGSVKCVVINEQKNIREALVTRGHHFDCRPNFERYRKLFSGNKENCKCKPSMFKFVINIVVIL